MKAAYVAPAMNVTVFQANESVAACYTITCKDSGESMVVKNSDYPRLESDILDTNGDGLWHDRAGIFGDCYHGTIGGDGGDYNPTLLYSFHRVIVTAGAEGHPNASN